MLRRLDEASGDNWLEVCGAARDGVMVHHVALEQELVPRPVVESEECGAQPAPRPVLPVRVVVSHARERNTEGGEHQGARQQRAHRRAARREGASERDEGTEAAQRECVERAVDDALLLARRCRAELRIHRLEQAGPVEVEARLRGAHARGRRVGVGLEECERSLGGGEVAVDRVEQRCRVRAADGLGEARTARVPVRQ